MNPNLFFGTVSFISDITNTGLITPDQALPNNQKVSFERKNYVHEIFESKLGELELGLATGLGSSDADSLKQGDQIIYERVNGHSLPTAGRWCLASKWLKALKIIANRPHLYLPLVRLCKTGENHFTSPYMWEGFLDIFCDTAKVTKDNVITSCRNDGFEWRLAHGWQRLDKVDQDKLIAVSPNDITLDDIFRSLRFYLAYLLERGLEIVEDRSTPVLSPSINIVVLAAIGRVGTIEGVGNLWGLRHDYVNGSHARVSQMTHLPSNFLLEKDRQYGSFTWDQARGIVEDLRRDEEPTSTLYQANSSELVAK